MSIILDQLTKRYSGQDIVDRVSLEVSNGEFFVLLGASGSGKSTLLRLIAGLAFPDSGKIVLHDRDVTALPPQQRGTGFVFQNYSIFRHMSVAENIEFGLKIRGVSGSNRARRRDELLELVGLAGLGGRYADQLSGGQQQRVALARALAYEPNVLLLDEPFGALDVKIRTALRRSFKEIQRTLRVTTILVTHDQEEAFELADRIGVVERGRLLEVGAPEELYARPRSVAVATFLGAGTVLMGRAENNRARFGPISLPIPDQVVHQEHDPVRVLLRPEQVELSVNEPTHSRPVLGRGKIVEQTFVGSLRRVRVRVPRLTETRQLAPPIPFGEQGLLIEAVLPAALTLSSDELWVSLRGWQILEQQPWNVLVYDDLTATAPLELAPILDERIRATITVLGIAREDDLTERLSLVLERRRREHGLARGQIRVRQGDPVDQVIGELNEGTYEFLLLADSSKSQFGRVRLGSVLSKIIERTQIPILIAKGKSRTLARVLICTAGGEPGKNDVRVGGRLARRLGASVTLLYVTNVSAQEAGAGSPTRWQRYLSRFKTKRVVPSTPPAPAPIDFFTRAHLERALVTLRELDVASEVRIRSARTPAEGILAEAGEGAYDLVVLGTHRAPTHALIGSTDVTARVLARLDSSILVVPVEEV
ncbi:MAG TPA: ATP-binding cassette domain-containing protein [Anaerolineae bacterium]